jgi:hypothetical protein
MCNNKRTTAILEPFLLPSSTPPHRTIVCKGSSCHQLAGSNARAFVFFREFIAANNDFEHNLDAVANGGASNGSDGCWV